MGWWGVFLGLRIFFLKIFHPKIKSVQNGLKCKKHIKNFSLLNNYSLRPGQKAMARAGSIWIIWARAVHFLAQADTPWTGRALRRSCGKWDPSKEPHKLLAQYQRPPDHHLINTTPQIYRIYPYMKHLKMDHSL